MIKKIIFFVLLTVSATVTKAQTNPKSGYVITNTGDTIRGTIDFRTNEKLSKQCDFWANGGNIKTTYKPGDIEGFRFDHNGKYFVTRRLNVTGEPEMYFAEFMVHGKMNLYCIAHNSDEYYFFEREDGEMAELTNKSINYASEQVAFGQAREVQQEKREQYGKVKSLLQKSWKAVEGIDDNYMSKKKLVKVVRDYHNDVCTDGSSCMVYEYKEESDNVKAHFKAFAGYAYYATEKTDNQHFMGENYPGSTYEIGLGVEVDLERIMKGFSAELGLAFTPKYESSHETKTYGRYRYNCISKYEKSILTFSVGAVKRFGNGTIQPLVRGGGFIVVHMGTKEEYTYKYERSDIVPTKDIYDQTWSNSTHIGAYLGAGVQMAINKHYVRLHGDWYKSLEPKSSGEMMKWGVTAEFGF